MQIKCDDETGHGPDQAAQNRRNTTINTATTSSGTPPAAAADGVPLKARSLDAARAAGAVV